MLCEMTKTDTEGKCGDATSFLGRGNLWFPPAPPSVGCSAQQSGISPSVSCAASSLIRWGQGIGGAIDMRFAGMRRRPPHPTRCAIHLPLAGKAERLASALSAASRSAERIVAAPGTFCGITRASLASFPSLQTQKTSLPFERGFRIHNEVARTLQDFDAPSGIKIGIPAAQRACVRGHCPLRH